VGATPTLPPHPQPTTASRQRLGGVDHDLAFNLDQPLSTPAAPAADQELKADLALQEAAARRHRELAAADPAAWTPESPEPLGRRLPVPLTSREGVER
jgi:hypothetical protein